MSEAKTSDDMKCYQSNGDTASVILLCKTDHTLVLLHRRSKGLKTFPNCIGTAGGRCESEDATFHDTACRETLEETGIDVSQLSYTIIENMKTKRGRRHVTFVVEIPYEYSCVKPSGFRELNHIFANTKNHHKWCDITRTIDEKYGIVHPATLISLKLVHLVIEKFIYTQK